MIVPIANVFINPAGLSGTDTASPANYIRLDAAHYHKMVENLQHLVAYIERSEPQKIKSAHAQYTLPPQTMRMYISDIIQSYTKNLRCAEWRKEWRTGQSTKVLMCY